MVPRKVRIQQKEENNYNLNFLLERLNFCLKSEDKQFTRECALADAWDSKHAAQQQQQQQQQETDSAAEEDEEKEEEKDEGRSEDQTDKNIK